MDKLHLIDDYLYLSHILYTHLYIQSLKKMLGHYTIAYNFILYMTDTRAVSKVVANSPES